MKNKYTTLIDRTWKGKEWFTSYRSYVNVRTLSDEEAKPLLEEAPIKLFIPKKPYKKNVMGSDDGRMFCNLCGSREGFYIKKRPFGHNIEIYTCANCGEREKRTQYVRIAYK